MKKAKILTVLTVLLAMGITACGAKPTPSSNPESSGQGGGGESSQGGGESSQGGGDSSTHTHSFGDWAPKDAATYTEFGSEERVCECGEKETRDVNTIPYDIDQTSEVIKLNGDSKKVSQFTYNNGAAKVAAVPMKEISGAYATNPVEGEKEKWTVGDAVNQAAADTYKLSNSGNGMALLFKVNVTAAIENAFISIGAKYSNNNPRYFKNHGDGGQNGDNPEKDAYRYYTKVNEGEFQPIAYNNLMSSVFGDGKSVCYMPLGKFNLKAGDNDIYVRQANLGYRVTLEGYLFVNLGATGEIGGTVPAHQHQAGTEWKSNETQHWHECVGANCDEQGIKLEAANHTFGEKYDEVAATCQAEGSYKQKCTVCDYVKTVKVEKLDHELTNVSYKENDGKVEKIGTCSVGEEKIISVAMNQIAGAYKTVAVEGQEEKWTIGDAANLTPANAYKLDKGTAIKFEVFVDKAIDNVLFEVGAQYKNDGSRKWANMHDPEYNNNNGDKDTEDEWRYYAKVNDGDFFHPDYDKDVLINSVLANGKVKYFSFGNISLKAGKNEIYLRQANLGYRVEPEDEIRLSFKGDATITGTDYVPPHEHTWSVGTPDASGISTLTCSGCDKTGIQFDGFTGDNAAAIDGDMKVTKKFAFKWNVKMPKAGKVALMMSFAYSAGNQSQKFGTGYAIKVGDTNGTITLGDVAFNTLLKQAPTCTFIEIGTIDVSAGDIELDYTHGNQGTRLISDKLVRLIYVD